MNVLIYPGQVSEPLSLLECLRQLHEEAQAERAADIAARAAAGVPLDDATDFPRLTGAADLLRQASIERDGAQVRERALEVLRLTAGPLEPLPDFVPAPNLAGLSVRVCILSAARFGRLQADAGAAWRALDAAIKAEAGEVVLHEASEAVMRAKLQLVGEAVQAVLGFPVTIERDGNGLRGEDLEALRLFGLIDPLYRVAVAHQGLPRGKGWRSGPQLASTSQSTTAAPAQSISARSVAATVVPLDAQAASMLGGPGPATPATRALDVS